MLKKTSEKNVCSRARRKDSSNRANETVGKKIHKEICPLQKLWGESCIKVLGTNE